MEIKETSIPDIDINPNENDLNIGREARNYLSPLLEKDKLEKVEKIITLRKELNQLQKMIRVQKNNMLSIKAAIDKQRKIENLFSLIHKVVKFGLCSKNNDLVLLLKGCNNLCINLIDQHIQEYSKIINDTIKAGDLSNN